MAYYNAWGGISSICKGFKYQQQTINGIEIDEVDLQPIRFQGQFYDVETGLHYNRFRYYDCDLGMFISRDPIGLWGGNNVFAYAPNPTGWVDPWGLSSKNCPQKKCCNDNQKRLWNAKNAVTKRWINILSGKNPQQVRQILEKQGFSYDVTNQNSPKQSHHQFSRMTKSGQKLVLDYNPVGQLHGGPYWKVFKADKLQGRIFSGTVLNYDQMKLI